MCIDIMCNLTRVHITGLVSVFVCLSGYTNGRLLHPMLPGYNAVGRETLQAHADVRRPQMTACEKTFYFSKALVYEMNRICVTSFIGCFRTHGCLCKNWLRLNGSIYQSGFETRMSTLRRLELQPDTVQRRGCPANPGRGSC